MSKQNIKNGICAGFILIGFLDGFSLLKLGMFHGLLFFAALLLIIELLLGHVNRKYQQKDLKFLQKLILIIAGVELTVFQFNSFHLLDRNYPEIKLDLTKGIVNNFDFNSHENIASGQTSFEFPGIDVPIGTISFEAESNVSYQAVFSISIKDETYSADYRYNTANAVVLKNNVRSQTVPCNFSGTVSDLKITFNTSEGEYIHVDSITVNKPIAFQVSWTRFCILLLISMSVYLLTCSEVMKKSYAENEKVIKATAWVFTAVLMGCALFLSNSARYQNPNHSITADFHSDNGDQITKELVDAFESGQIYLWEATPELQALDNPYDDSQRRIAGVGYPWDHLYFDGKIYSYYGIGPVILLFLPYHKLTGYYFPTVWACFLFGCIGIIFMTKFWLCFVRKFFRQTRSSLILTGLFLMQLSSGIWFCFSAPLFYEIAQTSGFAATMTGAYFLMSSNVIGDGVISKTRLALSSVFLSIAVLCRPTLAVYCICAMLFVFGGFLKLRRAKTDKKNFKKNHINYALSAFVPYALIGGGQMIYNYARFGSITDFGIDYSLTINDFTSTQYHSHFALIGIFSYLFQTPSFVERFPFLDAGWTHTFNPQGYYFVATGAAFGLLWKAPVILSYFRAKQAYSLSDSRDKKLYTAIIGAVSVAAPLAILISIWESGYGARYCVDFNWQIMIGAFVIAFSVFQHCKENMQNLLNKIMTASCVFSLMLAVAQTYNWTLGNYSIDWKASIMSFGRLFEFWI